MRTGSFPAVKCGRGVLLTTHPLLVPLEEWSYTSTHPLGHTGPVTGSLYLYLSLYLFCNKFKAYHTISTAININVQIHTADFYIMTQYKQFGEY